MLKAFNPGEFSPEELQDLNAMRSCPQAGLAFETSFTRLRIKSGGTGFSPYFNSSFVASWLSQNRRRCGVVSDAHSIELNSFPLSHCEELCEHQAGRNF